MSLSNKRAHQAPLVDLQVNGGWGVDLLSCSPQEFLKLASNLNRSGVGYFCPTLITSSFERLKQRLEVLAPLVDQSASSRSGTGAKALGFHLEGPMINKDRVGVHPKKWARALTLEQWDRLYEAAHGKIVQVTFAPETLSVVDAKKFVKWALDKNIRLSLGHSNATYDEARTFFDWGVDSVTHAFNAMRFHHRDPGILGAAVGNKNIFVQVIPHVSHVHPVLVDWLQHLHGADRIIAVSDMAPVSGLSSEKKAHFGDFVIKRSGDAAIHSKFQTLAGVAVPLSNLFKYSKKNGFSFLDRRAFSATPLRFLRKRVNS